MRPTQHRPRLRGQRVERKRRVGAEVVVWGGSLSSHDPIMPHPCAKRSTFRVGIAPRVVPRATRVTDNRA